MGLVSTAYFDTIVREMVKAGFALISRVTISDQDMKYHVPATMARDTRLVFHVLGKQLIILLAYHENDYYETGKVQSYWTINAFIGFRPAHELLRIRMEALHLPDLTNWEKLEMLEVQGQPEITLEGFSQAIWYGSENDLGEQAYEQFLPHGEPLAQEKVVMAAVALRDILLPQIAPGRFDRLQVTTLPPYYTFPGCESLFWSRFDTKYFRNVVRDPWGSAGY